MKSAVRNIQEQPNKEEKTRTWSTSILLLLLALVSISLTTLAWFTIADNTRLRGIHMDVTTGPAMRFDLDPHDTFERYVKTLTFAEIAGRVQQVYGYSISDTPMSPVTTGDCSVFTFEDGTVVPADKGTYITCTLHFVALQDMYVHLTSAHAGNTQNGTSISSPKAGMKESMRIAFVTQGKTWIYDPGMRGDQSVTKGNVKTFGLPDASNMSYTEDNEMFFLEAEKDLEVQMYIWLEGTDEYCTNELKGSLYSIALRFQGTDADGDPLLSE